MPEQLYCDQCDKRKPDVQWRRDAITKEKRLLCIACDLDRVLWAAAHGKP